MVLLGEDWNEYAIATVFKKNEENKFFLPSSIIFNNALEIWLELRKEINFMNDKTEENKKINENKQIIETDVKFEVSL